MKLVIIMISMFGVLNVNIDRLEIPEYTTGANGTLKTEVFKILDQKCNSCHRKQNPFMVFSTKNMERRATKIYEQVFIKQRMPKGGEVKLTQEEYNHLKKWLDNQLNK